VPTPFEAMRNRVKLVSFTRRGEVTEHLEAEESEKKLLEEIRQSCVTHRA